MEFRNYLFGFLKYIGKSILATVLISLIGFCLLTQTFPPDLGRLKNLYVSFQKLSALSKEIRESQALQANATSKNPQDEDKNLEDLLKHRRQTLNLLSQINLMKTAEKSDPSSDPLSETSGEDSAVPRESDPRAVVLSSESYNNLRLQIKELNEENQKLRQELANSSN